MIESILNLEASVLQKIFVKSVKFYNVKLGSGGPWADASSINRSYLSLHHENILEIVLSLSNESRITIFVENGQVQMKECESEFKEVDGTLRFTYENPPVVGIDVYKQLDHPCYGDYLVGISKLEDETGFKGYSFCFAAQDVIYIYAISNDEGEFLIFESTKPRNFRETGIKL